LHVCALSYANRHLTDGRVPAALLHRLAGIPDPADAVARLIEEGMWTEAAGGWQIVDYLSTQPSRAKVLATREKRTAAGQAGGIRSGTVRRSKSKAKPKQVASPVLEPPSRGTKFPRDGEGSAAADRVEASALYASLDEATAQQYLAIAEQGKVRDGLDAGWRAGADYVVRGYEKSIRALAADLALADARAGRLPMVGAA
jgi:hypothetical protein